MAAQPPVIGDGYILHVGASGGLEIRIGDDAYFVESSYSYPGEGPFHFANATSLDHWQRLTDPIRLSAYLERSKVKILALAPWIDYDNYDERNERFVSRDEFRVLVRTIKENVHQVDPSIRLLGCIEAPFVSLPMDLVEEFCATLPADATKGYLEFTHEQTDILRRHPEAWERWRESMVWTQDGRAKYELYTRGGVRLIALTVRPVAGNGQHAYLMDQARFVLEDVGLDGIYVDSFTGAKHSLYGYTYDRWDGLTVDIDPDTGRIIRRYTDFALAGTQSRRELIEYALGRGGTVVTNGHPIARETQALRALHFNESEWAFDPFSWETGEKPPLNPRPYEAQLTSPIALGVRPGRLGDRGLQSYAEVIMKMVIAYLRHGVLYYHYGTEIPEHGPGSGECGPINRMFPITPSRLGEGFVEGHERIVTCVSGSFDWPRREPPRIHLFDITGRPREHRMKPVRTGDGWRVAVDLSDWQEIAVVEA